MISVLKVEYQVVLVSLISNFFTDKTFLANKWMSFSSNNLALGSNLARFRICKIRKDGRKRNHLLRWMSDGYFPNSLKPISYSDVTLTPHNGR
jgi:hypothetical protein